MARRPDYVVSQYHGLTGNTGSFLLRTGDLKLITFGNSLPAFSRGNGYTPQLFNLTADPDETHDLAAKMPAKVKELDALLRHELSRGTALP